LAGLALLTASGISRSEVTFGITLDVPLFAPARLSRGRFVKGAKGVRRLGLNRKAETA